MPNPWSQLGLSFVFFMIAFFGFCLQVVTLLLGGGDHDVDHDVDHDMDHDAEHGADHDSGSGNLSPFSFRVMTAFLTGFGVGGFFAAQAKYQVLGCSLWGIVGGLAFGTVAYTLMNFLYKSQANSAVTSRNLLGTNGVVETTIDPGKLGSVTCEVNGKRESFLARSTDRCVVSLPVNTLVRIVQSAGTVLIVEPADQVTQPKEGQV